MRQDRDPSLPTRALTRLGATGRAGAIVARGLERRRALGRRGVAVQAWQERRMAEHQRAWYRRLWEQTASAVGARVTELGDGFLLVRRAERETIVAEHRVMLDHPATTALALDKSLVYRLLSDRGIPVPDHAEVPSGDLAAAEAFLGRAGADCVVKPSDGTAGGAGVTCGVRTRDDLWRAWSQAAPSSPTVIIERAVFGDEYRLLFLDGRLLGTIRRTPATLRGDGRSTVGELVAAENRRRLEDGGASEVTRLLDLDLDARLTLQRQGLTLRSVPADGAAVQVKRAVSGNGRTDNETVHGLADELVAVAAAAACETRLRLAGVDLVTGDPTRPLAEAGGAILEVNGTPGLHYHYQVAAPDGATRVAAPVLEALLA